MPSGRALDRRQEIGDWVHADIRIEQHVEASLGDGLSGGLQIAGQNNRGVKQGFDFAAEIVVLGRDRMEQINQAIFPCMQMRKDMLLVCVCVPPPR